MANTPPTLASVNLNEDVELTKLFSAPFAVAPQEHGLGGAGGDVNGACCEV